MKYRISGDGWQREWTAHTGPLGREWRVTNEGGKEWTFSVEELEAGVLRLASETEVHTVSILPGNGPGEPLRFLLDDHPVELIVQDEIDLLTEVLGDAGSGSGRHELKSVMPGIIRGLLVQEGEAIEVDGPLLILEAMKMENEIRSPAQGTVTRIAVAEGQTVAAGELLAVIEAG